ncbi:MAG: ion transporter [Spirochaetota bacterium]
MKRYNIIENFIFVCIILVIIQTLLDNISILQQWPVQYRNMLLVAGFAFDFIFTIEFISRSISASAHKRFLWYFWYRRGWVDLFSSVPLLLLNSGPELYILLSGDTHMMSAGIGMLNILKVIKAIRVTRVLRLIRIVKIFGKIHNTDSPMAQHHTATVTTMAVFSVICTLLVFSFFSDVSTEAVDDRITITRSAIDTIESLNENTSMSRHDIALEHFDTVPYILEFTYNDTPVIPLRKDVFDTFYTYNDHTFVEYKGYTALISLMDINSKQALDHIKYFIIIVMIVLGFTFLYTRHFVQNVTDVLHILNLGFRKKDYNLQIKINPYYQDHEVYRLAQFYNEAYLPAKLKRQEREKKQAISMKDLLKFNS